MITEGGLGNQLRIQQRFNLAATHYDSVADLQREAGHILLQHAKESRIAPKSLSDSIVDLGSGTGYFTQQLAKLHQAFPVIAVDFAWQMLYQAKSTMHLDNRSFICADFDHLPFADASIGMIYSNLALQWSPNMAMTLAEIHRILIPNGVAIFSSLGSKTLYELKQAWQLVDDYKHVNDFTSGKLLDQQIKEQHFHQILSTRQEIIKSSTTVKQLLNNLKQIGANVVTSNYLNGLQGKSKYQALVTNYERFRKSDGLLPTTYELLNRIIYKPVESGYE